MWTSTQALTFELKPVKEQEVTKPVGTIWPLNLKSCFHGSSHATCINRSKIVSSLSTLNMKPSESKILAHHGKMALPGGWSLTKTTSVGQPPIVDEDVCQRQASDTIVLPHFRRSALDQSRTNWACQCQKSSLRTAVLAKDCVTHCG